MHPDLVLQQRLEVVPDERDRQILKWLVNELESRLGFPHGIYHYEGDHLAPTHEKAVWDRLRFTDDQEYHITLRVMQREPR